MKYSTVFEYFTYIHSYIANLNLFLHTCYHKSSRCFLYELVLELLRNQGDVRRADVVELLHVTKSQAFRILNRLAKAQKNVMIGKGAGSKFFVRFQENEI